MLSELSTTQRRDFNSLVAILNRRFGSVERSELFRAKLKNRTKSDKESLSELAQSVKKLTRKAYPTAAPDLTNVLSLDHFIDALSEANLRLRLRESRPKNINEAETLAIRLETYKLADTQKVKQVNAIHSDTDSSLITSIREENKILRNDFQSLTKEIRALLNNGQKVKSNFAQKTWQNNQTSIDQTRTSRNDQNARPKQNQNKSDRQGNKPWSRQNSTPNQGNSPRSGSGVGNRPRGVDPNSM